ncbi:MAG: short-chain fatty acyl-CoA regulator family protein [Polyangiales bacterium]
MARDAAKARLGEKVRMLRRQRDLSQVALAERLGVSASYLNLIENNKRPLPATLLLRVAEALTVDLSAFSSGAEARLDADLMEVFSDPMFEGDHLTNADVREFVQSSPSAARAVLTLYRAWRQSQGQADVMAQSFLAGEDHPAISATRSPSEDVNDFIQARGNHFAELEGAAESLCARARLETDDMFRGLAEHLTRAHDVGVTVVRSVDERGTLRRYDAAARRIFLSELLPTRSRTFQLAHQIALLECRDAIDSLCEDPTLSTDDARALARVALANYFAGAVVMPYARFVEAARRERYDLDVLGRRFRVGFEQVCHRLTTLRRPGAEAVPFHMIRIDVAGNISKRFSGSGIRFARFSGACPRWNVFQAFLTPGMIRIQISEMPDGEVYFCLARSIMKDAGGFHDQQPVQAIGLGCKVEHARSLVYADGLDLDNPRIVVPVGVTCRICERHDCSQRAHPSLRQPLHIDENVRGQTLYTLSRRG